MPAKRAFDPAKATGSNALSVSRKRIEDLEI